MSIDLTNENNLTALIINLLGGVAVILLDRAYMISKKLLKAVRYRKLIGPIQDEKFMIVYGKMKLKQVFDNQGNVENWPYIKNSGAQFRISEPVSFTEMQSAKYVSESIVTNGKTIPQIVSDDELANRYIVSYCSLGGYNNIKTIEI